MIDISKHVVVIDGKEMVPYDLAIEAIKQAAYPVEKYTEQLDSTINELKETINNIKLT